MKFFKKNGQPMPDVLDSLAEATKSGRFNRREYNYRSWSRSFTLPENCNYGKIEAEYKNGELKIVIPKMEVKEPKKVKSISVN